MKHELTPNWQAETLSGRWAYYCHIGFHTAKCPHPPNSPHSLGEAVACGMLAAVRAKRGLTQEGLARVLHCTTATVGRWECGGRRPSGLYREALEQWLLQSVTSRNGKLVIPANNAAV